MGKHRARLISRKSVGYWRHLCGETSEVHSYPVCPDTRGMLFWERSNYRSQPATKPSRQYYNIDNNEWSEQRFEGEPWKRSAPSTHPISRLRSAGADNKYSSWCLDHPKQPASSQLIWQIIIAIASYRPIDLVSMCCKWIGKKLESRQEYSTAIGDWLHGERHMHQ